MAVGLVLGMLFLVTVFGSKVIRTWVEGRPQQGQETPIHKPGDKTGTYRLVCITDTHLLADSLYDGGTAFSQYVAEDDGKVTAFVPEVLEALTEEIIKTPTDVVILSGDLTINGEKASHQQLASILHKIQEQGIQVLVVPGNHDINNHSASAFRGEERISTDPVTPQEFLEIYQTFGYEQAFSRDEFSLSYMYELSENKWLMMLDTNDYEPVNIVYGMLKEETLGWMDRQLAAARETDAEVIVVGHHNLLPESRLYTQMCTIENRQAAIDLFADYQVPLYISGHLHALREKKNKTGPGMPEEVYGIYERVNSALCIPPCQYAVVTWSKDGSWSHETRAVDVEGWAAGQGRTEEELLHFREFSRQEFYRIIGNQIAGKIDTGLPEEMRQEMGLAYAELLYCYGAGIKLDKSEFRRSRGYELWEHYRPDSKYLDEMKQILNDL